MPPFSKSRRNCGEVPFKQRHTEGVRDACAMRGRQRQGTNVPAQLAPRLGGQPARAPKPASWQAPPRLLARRLSTPFPHKPQHLLLVRLRVEHTEAMQRPH